MSRWCLIVLLSLCLIGCAPHSSLPKPKISQGTASTQVPFEWLRTGDVGGLILLDLDGADLNGKWIVDTGASVNVISDKLFSSKEFKSSQTSVVQSATGGHKATVVVLPDLRIGNWVYQNQAAVVLDMSHYHEKLGVDIQGILGMPIFATDVLTINGPKQTLTLSKAGSASVRGQAEVQIRLLNGVPVIDMKVSGQQLQSVILDTGNAGGLVIFPGFATKAGLLKPESKYVRHQAQEVGGVVTAYLAIAETAQVGDVQLEKLVTAILEEGEQKQEGPMSSYSASLGMAALEHLQVRLDFVNGIVRFSTGTSGSKLEGGWGVIFGGNGLVIDSVLPFSPANKAGLTRGDKVVSLVGHKLDGTVAEFWQKTHVGDPIAVTVVSSQGTRTIVLKREHFLPALNW